MAERFSGYQPFDADTEIRLFTVRTSFLHRGMKFDFCRVKLSNPGPYIAISYQWGSNQIVNGIDVDDGIHIDLTASACDIIDHVFAKRRRKGWVWMDAVCIDQSNEAEKRRQVALMGKIYSSASQVFACIDPRFVEGDLALRFVPKVIKVLKQHKANGIKGLQKTTQRLLDLRPSVTGWPALWVILRSSFFERMWIVQEMIMAPSRSLNPEEDKSLIITSRKEYLPFMKIAYVASELRRHRIMAGFTIDDDDKTLPLTLYCAQQMGGLRQKRLNNQAISMDYALRACVEHKAKHGVDKIYAVMNFVQDDPLIDDLRSTFTERFCREEDKIRLARAAEDGNLRSREEDAVIWKRRDEEDFERRTREVSIVWKLILS